MRGTLILRGPALVGLHMPGEIGEPLRTLAGIGCRLHPIDVHPLIRWAESLERRKSLRILLQYTSHVFRHSHAVVRDHPARPTLHEPCARTLCANSFPLSLPLARRACQE